jgi:hypothetical protein
MRLDLLRRSFTRAQPIIYGANVKEYAPVSSVKPADRLSELA